MTLPRLLVLGDSISVHYWPFLERAVAGSLQCLRRQDLAEALADLDRPAGANSGDSAAVLARLRSAETRGGIAADILLLNCGLHDIKTDPSTGRRQVPLQAYGDNLRQIAGLVQRMGLRLVWVRTTPCDDRIHNAAGVQFHRYAADCDAYNAAADAVMAEAGVPLIDLHAFTLRLERPLYCDHVHFCEPIRSQQGAFIGGWLIGRFGGGAFEPKNQRHPAQGP